MKYIQLLILSLLAVTGCTTSWVVAPGNHILQPQSQSALASNPVTVFLLERDIPADINRLGVVMISPVAKGGKLDQAVKTELQKQCQRLGANGAFRLSEGYYPAYGKIPYLVFKYEPSGLAQRPTQ